MSKAHWTEHDSVAVRRINIRQDSLLDLAKALGVKLEVEQMAEGRWHVRFASAEVKRGIMLESAYGVGSTPDKAAEDYARQLCHKTIVVHAMSPDRRRELVTGIVLPPGGAA